MSNANNTRRFLRFDFDHYYPLGGIDDLTGEYETVEEAIAAPFRTRLCSSAAEATDPGTQIVDRETLEVVFRSGSAEGLWKIEGQ